MLLRQNLLNFRIFFFQCLYKHRTLIQLGQAYISPPILPPNRPLRKLHPKKILLRLLPLLHHTTLLNILMFERIEPPPLLLVLVARFFEVPGSDFFHLLKIFEHYILLFLKKVDQGVYLQKIEHEKNNQRNGRVSVMII
jgi:hypothetical protein